MGGNGKTALKGGRKWMSKREKRDALYACGFLLLNVIGFLTFTLSPVVSSFVISFFRWPVLQPPEFIGLQNYVTMFTNDPQFFRYLGNTFQFALLYVPLAIVSALALGIWLSKKFRFIAFFRVLFFLPVLSPSVAISSIWRWIYNPDYGLINSILRSVNVANPPRWLGDPKLAMFSVVLCILWSRVGYNAVIFIAGIKGIPETLYEAADIDGGNAWSKFWRITLPLLSPSIFFVLVITLINSFQVFDQIYVMTNGGPMGATTTLVFSIYRNGFEYFNMGYASAMAWVLFAIIFALTLLNLQMQKNWVNYDL